MRPFIPHYTPPKTTPVPFAQSHSPTPIHSQPFTLPPSPSPPLPLQAIFTSYPHPFILTWLGASLLAVYLPIALIKEFIQYRLRIEPLETLVFTPREIELSSHPSPRLGGDADLESDEESRQALVDKIGSIKAFSPPPLTTWGLIKTAFLLAPLWLLTEVSIPYGSCPESGISYGFIHSKSSLKGCLPTLPHAIHMTQLLHPKYP